MRNSIVAFLLLIAAVPALADCPAAWGYEAENGPDRWGQMDKAWAPCDTGKRQSPVDIVNAAASKSALPDLTARYGAFPITVQNTGHEIKVWPLADGHLLVGTEVAMLVQFHFHVPGEHEIDGQSADAEMHIVHVLPNKTHVALGVLIYKDGNDKPNAGLAPILDLAPDNACTSAKADDYSGLQALLPVNINSYFTYQGSLTTPACDETVTWYVLREPVTASEEQIKQLRVAHGAEGNARPVQPLGKRVIRRR